MSWCVISKLFITFIRAHQTQWRNHCAWLRLREFHSLLYLKKSAICSQAGLSLMGCRQINTFSPLLEIHLWQRMTQMNEKLEWKLDSFISPHLVWEENERKCHGIQLWVSVEMQIRCSSMKNRTECAQFYLIGRQSHSRRWTINHKQNARLVSASNIANGIMFHPIISPLNALISSRSDNHGQCYHVLLHFQ